MQSATPAAWTYVPHASPGYPVTLASSADVFIQVFTSDAVCIQDNGAGLADVLIPLNGSAVSTLTVPSDQYDAGLLGPISDAVWMDTLDGTVSCEPWGGWVGDHDLHRHRDSGEYRHQ